MTNEPKLKPKKMTYTRLDYPSELEKARMVGWNNCCDDWEEYLRQKIDVGEIEEIIKERFAVMYKPKPWEFPEGGTFTFKEMNPERMLAEAIAEHFEGKGNPMTNEPKLKHKDFEDFLMDYHCRNNPELLDDMLPEAFDDWVSNLDSDDFIKLGDKYFNTRQKIDVGEIEAIYNKCGHYETETNGVVSNAKWVFNKDMFLKALTEHFGKGE